MIDPSLLGRVYPARRGPYRGQTITVWSFDLFSPGEDRYLVRAEAGAIWSVDGGDLRQVLQQEQERQAALKKRRANKGKATNNGRVSK